jgi:hypothetical protein
MRDIPKYTFSASAFSIAMVLPTISISFNNITKWLAICASIIAIGGLAISFGITIWNNQPKKSSFINNLKISFGLSAVVFIAGYIFAALHPIFM